MPANGRLPNSMLAPIPGGRLRKDAALRWNAMIIHVRRKTGVTIFPTGPHSSYRNLAGQVLMRRQWCAAGKCGNAAVPGTSNHGWGTTVDTPRHDLVNRYGARFGFQKRWSDASWEPWHMKWAGFGRLPAYRLGDRVIARGVSAGDDIRALALLLRRLGYLPPKFRPGRSYTWRIRRAVKRAQRDNYVTADGMVGPGTLHVLRAARKLPKGKRGKRNAR